MLMFVELVQNVVFITDTIQFYFFLHISTHTHLLVFSVLCQFKVSGLEMTSEHNLHKHKIVLTLI